MATEAFLQEREPQPGPPSGGQSHQGMHSEITRRPCGCMTYTVNSVLCRLQSIHSLVNLKSMPEETPFV